ncbi:MAG: hypothetical protein AAGI01_16150 [Myxococcota bacterium]
MNQLVHVRHDGRPYDWRVAESRLNGQEMSDEVVISEVARRM